MVKVLALAGYKACDILIGKFWMRRKLLGVNPSLLIDVNAFCVFYGSQSFK